MNNTSISHALKDKELSQYIEKISDERIKDFVTKSISLYGDTNKLIRANQVAELMIAKFTKGKQYNPDSPQQQAWFELLLAATLLHNLFYDSTLTSLFMAREKLWAYGEEAGLPEQALEPIFQAIEGQLGEDTPVSLCKPGVNSPISVMADCCWFIEELHGRKKPVFYRKEL